MGYKMQGYGSKTGLLKIEDENPPRKKDEGPVENRIYVSNHNKVGGYVEEGEFESKFKLEGDNPKDYPQISVQDYSTVKQDSKGKYVVKL